MAENPDGQNTVINPASKQPGSVCLDKYLSDSESFAVRPWKVQSHDVQMKTTNYSFL